MRSVVLTGVSRGLGAALFAELADRGERILGIGRRFTDEQNKLAAVEPDRVRLYRADLANPATLPDAAVLRDFLRDECVLIHNAGVIEPIGAISDLSPAAVAAAVTINLTAPMLLTDAFLRARPADSATRILFVSSGAAHRVIDGWSVYSATKRGAEMFFDAVAVEQPNAYVVNVNPGVMNTDMQATLRDAVFAGRDRYVALYARGELPDPVEVARRIITEHIDRPISGE
jgi:NAD(P)-dependent dehydrogenase (short-subunit alcohol dehydrogenase family)